MQYVAVYDYMSESIKAKNKDKNIEMQVKAVWSEKETKRVRKNKSFAIQLYRYQKFVSYM